MSGHADQPLRVAVVGHTNTGKTSLMRTLLRDETFGEVADRPAVTTGVDAATLTAGGRGILELVDTPGLEDSVGLLETIDAARVHGDDPPQTLQRVLDGPESAPGARFGQEAMGLRQVMLATAALYVIDARDPVREKHRDELTILGMTGRPIVPVLNFTSASDARAGAWREQLRRVNMHATASFDTVVFDADGERRLFEMLRSLLHDDAARLDALIEARAADRRRLVRVAARLVAEMLVDVAAAARTVPVETSRSIAGGRAAGHPLTNDAVEAFRSAIREREAACTRAVLDLFRFDVARLDVPELDIRDAMWGLDLFSPEAVRRWGTSTGSTAAVGAGVGLGIDAAVGGLSGGMGALTGAAIGGLVGFGRTHGRRVLDRVRGRTELRADDGTLARLAARQLELAAVLFRRGHASVTPIAAGAVPAMGTGEPHVAAAPVVPAGALKRLRAARARPDWATDGLTGRGGHGEMASAGAGGRSPEEPSGPAAPGFLGLGNVFPDAARDAVIDQVGHDLAQVLAPAAGAAAVDGA